MISNVLFYSNVHLGDLHLSRSYIQWFIDHAENINFFYAHNQHPNALCDIDIPLIQDNFCYKLPQNRDIIKMSIKGNEFIAFNTWIGAGGLAVGCNFEACHINFTKYFKYLINNGVSFKSNYLPKLMPKINFSSSCIKREVIDKWFNDKKTKASVLIANNKVMSGQSINTNMNDYVKKIALTFPAIDFYLTNQEHPLISLPNVFYIEHITYSESEFSLNDIAYFSTFCDIIVGRGSGPFSFCEIEDNLNKTWISFTFEHLKSDSFNGLNMFDNHGKYIHTMNTEVLFEILKKEFINDE